MSDETITKQIQSAFERAHHVYESIGAVRERVDALVDTLQQELIQQGSGQSTTEQLDLYKRLLAVQAVYAHITPMSWDALEALDNLREEDAS
jgi:hypothetical protein